MCLLAAETQTGQDPGKHYRQPTAEFGAPHYTRIDPLATSAQKERLQRLSPDAVQESTLVGESSTAKLTRAPGNNAPIGGLNVIAPQRLVRHAPSGTENLCKVYAESFRSEAHPKATLTDVPKGTMEGSEPISYTAPFPAGYRSSGLLLHVVSFPSPYGIGDPGQALSPGSTGCAWRESSGGRLYPSAPGGHHSPYERLSSFVGHRLNPYLPENYSTNTVVYTATYDNARTGSLGVVFCRRPGDHSFPGSLEPGARGSHERVGEPGRELRWRATRNMLSAWNFNCVGDLTKISNKSGLLQSPLKKAAA